MVQMVVVSVSFLSYQVKLFLIMMLIPLQRQTYYQNRSQKEYVVSVSLTKSHGHLEKVQCLVV